MKCIYCSNPYTYELSNKQRKCSRCKRKFSPRKIAREEKLRALFIKGVNARKASKQTGMHFATIQKYFETFRKELALKSDEQYQQNSHRVTEYDEYLYLPKSLKAEESIAKVQHFLTLSYDGRVYNLMMPDIKRYRIDAEEKQKRSLLLKYLNFNKVAKLSKAKNTITEFWDYFEIFILQYRGVSDEQFVFYLKEAEWRFNERQPLPAPKQSLRHWEEKH